MLSPYEVPVSLESFDRDAVESAEFDAVGVPTVDKSERVGRGASVTLICLFFAVCFVCEPLSEGV